MEEVTWVDKALDLIDTELERVEREGNYKLIERVKAWQLRIKGYSIIDIADELGISVGTAHADVRWCIDHLPPAFETTEDFRRISLQQLEKQYERVTAGRNGEPPTEIAERVGIAIKDLQAKILGALAPTRIDSSIKLEYNITGVDTQGV